MATKYFLVQFVPLLITLMAIRTLGEQSWIQHTKGVPSGYAMVDDGDDGSGEICDPSKTNACESKTAQCLWRAIDMLYKCTEPRNHPKKRLVKRKKFKLDDKKNGTRKRMVKGFETPDSNRQSSSMNSINMKVNPFHKGGAFSRTQESSVENSNPDLIIGSEIKNDEKNPDRYVDLYATTGSQLEKTTGQPSPSQPSTESHDQVATQSVALFHDFSKAKGKIAHAIGRSWAQGRVSGNKPEGTWKIPKYAGDLTWDGHTVFSETCILKSVMADALQERKSMESKELWVEENREKICNFKKFFHCTIEQADSELVLDDGEEEDLPTEPVCRCYESAMPVVKGKCYIPADFGAKSACGDHVVAPYPIEPWRRAPKLKPRCTPNSDCKESQYWFGKRCTCRYNAHWNPQTHTCDKGTKLTMSLGLMFASYYAIIWLKY